jgi:hypothetical protein
MPDGKLRLEEFRAIRHRDGDTIARPTSGIQETPGDAPDARRPIAEGEMDSVAAGDPRPCGVAATALLQPGGDIHRSTSSRHRG